MFWRYPHFTYGAANHCCQSLTHHSSPPPPPPYTPHLPVLSLLLTPQTQFSYLPYTISLPPVQLHPLSPGLPDKAIAPPPDRPMDGLRGVPTVRLQGCTHRAMILCDGTIDSHRSNNLNPSHGGNTYHLRSLLFFVYIKI